MYIPIIHKNLTRYLIVKERILDQLMFFSFTESLSNWKLAAVTRQGTTMSLFAKRLVELMITCAQLSE